MDKKILKAIYANVVAKDDLRPVMNGVCFEEERCYGSDGHLWVIYNQGNKQFAGKIVAQNGEIIDGKYPNIDGVIPKEREEYPHRIDLRELYNACVYHSRKPDATPDDRVSILHKTFVVRSLVKLLAVYAASGELSKAVIYKSGQEKPTIIESKLITGMIMPTMHDESVIDQSSQVGEGIVMSYENLINDYAFNSWKKSESKEDLDWLK